MERVLVIGAGLFGLTGARELARRGARVTLLEAGAAPRDVAGSTDVSRIVRPDYGDDLLYTGLGERAFAAWPEWDRRLGGGLFHATGLLVATRVPLEERAMESATFDLLTARGHALERLRGAEIPARFPGLAGTSLIDGYVNPDAGWVASGPAIEALARLARQEGVDLREHTPVQSLTQRAGRVVGATTVAGETLEADLVLVAAGSWTPRLVPWLADRLRPVLQPVHLLRVAGPLPRLPVWAGDITTTGWYGFPALADGRIKVAHHGRGRAIEGDTRPTAPPEDGPFLRNALRDLVPALADASLVGGRWCPYCDSQDGDFWIGLDPERPGLAVAAGGSGHGFKFLPLLGDLVADACEDRLADTYARFRWRTATAGGADAMRCAGD